MNATELARWTRFAGKGGIGKCTALRDCVAERAEDLMFLKDDDITVLVQFPDHEGIFLGYCEGVVGRFQGDHVRFHSKLKKPVMTKRSSATHTTSPSPKRLSPIPTSPSAHRSPSTFPMPSNASVSPLASTSPHIGASSNGSLIVTHYDSASHSRSNSPSVTTPSMSNSSTCTPSESNSDTRQQVLTAAEEEPDKTEGYRSVGASPSSGSDSIHVHLPALKPGPSSGPRISTEDRSPGYLQENSYDESEPSTRISLAASDGEVGIGLSLLQDLMMNDEDMDNSSTKSGRSSHSPTRTPENVASNLPSGDSATPSQNNRSYSTTSSRNAPSRTSTQQHNAEDWEGASDIYDDYRYSRQSTVSKPARISMSSVQTGSNERPPPVPRGPRSNTDRCPSTDSDHSLYSQSVNISGVSTKPEKVFNGTSILKPLDLSVTGGAERGFSYSESVRSPLLHTEFGSPLSSPDFHTSEPPLYSPAIHSRESSVSGGVASALRQKFENGRASPSVVHTLTEFKFDNEDIIARVGGIVVEDDEEFVPHVASDSPEPISPTSSSSPSPKVAITAPLPLAIANRTPTPPGLTVKPLSPVTTSLPMESLISATPQSFPQLASSNIHRAENSVVPMPLASTSSSPNFSSEAIITSPQTVSIITTPFDPQPVGSHPPPAPRVQQMDPSQTSVAPQLRPRPSGQIEGSRRSLFLPHPNAPKPTASPSGPMYARSTNIQNPPHWNVAPESSAVLTIRAALGRRQATNCTQRVVTIYGRCEIDLSTSTSPVPMRFSVDPPTSVPMQTQPAAQSPRALERPSTAPSEVNTRQRSSPVLVQNRPSTASSSTSELSSKISNVIPRANFFPKAPGPRPRSRSFSGFDAEVPLLGERSLEEGSNPLKIPATRSTPSRSSTVAASSSTKPAEPRKPSPLRTSYSPSPLSLPENNSVRFSATTGTSPLSQPSVVASESSQAPPSPTVNRPHQLRQVTSVSCLNDTPVSPSTGRPPLSRIVTPSDSRSPSLPVNVQPPSLAASVPRASVSSRGTTSPALRPRASVDTVASQHTDFRLQAEQPNPGNTLSRNLSLRSKLSLSNLRGRSNARNRADDVTPGARESAPDETTMQVKDMDFELVRPSLPQQGSGRSSVDSAFTTREDSSDIKTDFSTGFSRSESPAISISSTVASGSPMATSERSFPVHRAKTSESHASMDAHRQRELKWVSVMASVPATQARKSKKVKKLLLDAGVPSSVRYLVWAHLMDSKARGVPGVYSQLAKRGRVSVLGPMELDVQRCFTDQPHLQSTQGPLLSLLQAYLTMVPDIQYHTGLTLIAGHLLLLAPEEDAFWIFVSMMDKYLRSYFSSNIMQIEVDAALFSKALERHDGPVAKKILVDFGINPVSICRPWFSSLFSGTLNVEYLHRVWDIALYEGLPFFLRVGLAIVSCCRRQLLESSNGEALLAILLRPLPVCLPPTIDAFISRVYAVKLKDDDVWKQRTKMESQLKQQTQSLTMTMSVSGAPASISAPRH